MTLMFDKNKVGEAGHPLVRLLRLIFYKKNITLDDFSALFAEHGQRLGISAVTTSNNRNNARKQLNRTDEMTFRLFQYILLNVLRMNVEEIRVVVRNEKGERITIGSNDPIE